MATAASAHAGAWIVAAQKRLPLPTGELRALIRLHRGLAVPNGHQERLQRQVCGHLRLDRPADDTTREHVDDEAEGRTAFVDLDASDISYPNLIAQIIGQLAMVVDLAAIDPKPAGSAPSDVHPPARGGLTVH